MKPIRLVGMLLVAATALTPIAPALAQDLSEDIIRDAPEPSGEPVIRPVRRVDLPRSRAPQPERVETVDDSPSFQRRGERRGGGEARLPREGRGWGGRTGEAIRMPDAAPRWQDRRDSGEGPRWQDRRDGAEGPRWDRRRDGSDGARWQDRRNEGQGQQGCAQPCSAHAWRRRQTPSSSTSNFRVAFGGMTPPAP